MSTYVWDRTLAQTGRLPGTDSDMARDATDRARRVMEEARRLLDACGIERPPVDLVRIARHLGIRRIRELDVRLDGQLVELGDGGYEVILSRNAPHTRQRFTLAHEIAHILVASPGDDSMSCGDTATEDLCNRVAAELLIPARFLADTTADLDVAAFRRLATRFQCSLEATAWRVLNLGQATGTLLIWRHRDDGGLELSASPRTFGFDAPFDNGHVLDGAMPFVRELMQRSEGPLSYAPTGKAYTGDYLRLNKVLLMYLRAEGDARTPKTRGRSTRAPGQGELFS